MFNVDDTANQPLADAYGIVMGSSHTGEQFFILFDEVQTDEIFGTHDASIQ
jgi:hypothetical protein